MSTQESFVNQERGVVLKKSVLSTKRLKFRVVDRRKDPINVSVKYLQREVTKCLRSRSKKKQQETKNRLFKLFFIFTKLQQKQQRLIDFRCRFVFAKFFYNFFRL
jgi:hypothetical protein